MTPLPSFSQRLLLATGLLLAPACAAPPAPKGQPVEEPARIPDLHQFMPLVDQTVSSFEMESDLGDKGIVTLEIFRPRPELAELKIAGRVQRLAIEEKRISQTTGGILLEAPLKKGHSFQGPFGTVTITETDQLISVPAGTFTGCLTTVEESDRAQKRSTSSFCPGIGLVSMKVESFGEEGPGEVTTRLTYHGARVELPKRTPPTP